MEGQLFIYYADIPLLNDKCDPSECQKVQLHRTTLNTGSLLAFSVPRFDGYRWDNSLI